MKKILFLFLSLFMIVGCSLTKDMTAKDAVTDYLERYRTHKQEVLDALDDYIASESDLSDSQKETYKEVLKKQYKNLKYKIVNETYDGNEALVTMKITVFDLYKAQKEANDYLNDNQDKFLDDKSVYDKSLFLDYKLDKMKDYTDQTDYTIDFHVVKNDKNKWEVSELSTNDLEKIHGIYQYES